MTWSEAKATPIGDIYTLNQILQEWDRKRAEAAERAQARR